MTFEQVHRQEWARVVAILARSFSDLDLAEDTAAEAFATALARWPVDGWPDNPGAWLVTVARNHALDRVRRESTRGDRQAAAHAALVERASAEGLDDRDLTTGPMADDRLRLLFTCCHPALAPEARIALTLRMVGGLTTAEVARAFLVPEATMSQRLLRAKRKIAVARISYHAPEAAELPGRLDGVLRVIALIFREGYSPSGGDRLPRAELCDEAIRLGRLLVELVPDEGEATAVLALMLLQHSRRSARLDDAGEVVLLVDQERADWDHSAIREGAALTIWALRRGRGRYALQAALAACHATAPSSTEVDWLTIVTLYDELAELDASPAVALNRAVAVAEVDGPRAALALLDGLALTDRGASLVRTSHQVVAVRADLLRRSGRDDEARYAYRQAITQAPTAPERRYFERRIRELTS
ncbi:MAG: sigma-70 family RNA polymerase sigma factor [Actinomycetota bacterium]|nr:sigma-70 family RNA polymerase sigma factor [Actinomycetota bacterium]